MLRRVLILVLAGCLSAAPLQQNAEKTLIRTKRDFTETNEAPPPDVDTKTLDKHGDVQILDNQPAEDMSNNPDVIDESSHSEKAAEAADAIKQEEEEDTASPAQSKEEAVNKIFDQEDQEKSEKEKEVEKIMNKNEAPAKVEQNSEPDYKEFLRNYIHNYLPYSGLYRKKRNSRPLAVTAEQMSRNDLKLKLRRKRDLDITPEELEYLLEAENGEPEVPAEGPIETYEGLEPEVNEPIEYGPEEEYGPDDGDALANAELLNYLYQNARNDEDQGYSPPSDVRESWEEYLPERDPDDVLYEPIVYNGTPGIFIPIGQKRQYLSLVPGNRRKRNNFYPADDSLNGRWGAFIADEAAVKRADAYDRLYELAEQLRSNPYDRDYYRKKK